MDIESRKPESWYVQLIIAVVLLMLGVYGMFDQFGYINRSWEARGSDDWTATTATIQAVDVSDEGDFLSDDSWMPSITYRYEVDGASHEGNRLSFYGRNNGLVKSEATLLASRFAVGDTIEVFFDPNDPTRSTMIRGISEEEPQGFVVDLLLIGLGLVMLWGVIADRIRARSQPQS